MEKHWPVHFEDSVGASPEKAEAFWSKCDLEDPQFFEHPMLKVPDWQKKFLPFFCHADEAEFCDRDSLMVASSSPLLGQGPSRDLKFLHWVWPSSSNFHGEEDGDESTLEEHW